MKMKKMFVAAGLILLATSCKKNEEPVLTEEEAADVVESTVSTKDAGVCEDYTEMAVIAVEKYPVYEFDCSYTDDTSYSIYQSSGIRTYDMDVNLAWTVDCSGGTVNTITCDYNRTGSYTGPRLTRTGSETGQLTFGNLESSFAYLTASGNLTANGTSDFSAQGTEKSISTVMTVTLTGLHIDKTSYQITEGSGTLNIEATGEDDSITLTGSITFLGSGQATVTINGTSYTIDLYN